MQLEQCKVTKPVREALVSQTNNSFIFFGIKPLTVAMKKYLGKSNEKRARIS